MDRPWKIAGINFSHTHMGDLLRNVHDHPRAEIAGICDGRRESMAEAIEAFSIEGERVFTDYRSCLETVQPDIVILCPETAEHALWVERIAPYGADLFVEKPFAASLAEADRMIAAVAKTGKRLLINWPLRWVASHVTTHRLIREGLIGDIIEVHYYDGNRGPLCHGADKIEREPTADRKKESWWYKKESGGARMPRAGRAGLQHVARPRPFPPLHQNPDRRDGLAHDPRLFQRTAAGLGNASGRYRAAGGQCPRRMHRRGGRFRGDPRTEAFVNDEAANRLCSRPRRTGWK